MVGRSSVEVTGSGPFLEARVSVVLACVPPQLLRILEMTGTDQVLRAFATTADAEAAGPPA
ncbi:hypothetical protein [Streptomyces sp. NPDC048419]|uniref:hypothetical protein n=1 Tax=Streptomyces sp. NPDC048419 TaxID=3365547 RepID=UPI00372243DB